MVILIIIGLLILWIIVDYIMQCIYDDHYMGTHTGLKEWGSNDHWYDEWLK